MATVRTIGGGEEGEKGGNKMNGRGGREGGRCLVIQIKYLIVHAYLEIYAINPGYISPPPPYPPLALECLVISFSKFLDSSSLFPKP